MDEIWFKIDLLPKSIKSYEQIYQDGVSIPIKPVKTLCRYIMLLIV